MSGAGKKPAIAPLPPPAPPAPTPEDISLEAQRKGEATRRKLLARKGRRSTILTEGGLGTLRPEQASSVLGQVGT
jgi:hypothetical protein